MQNRLLLVEVKNVLIQIDFNAKSTSTSRSEKCVDSNKYIYLCRIFVVWQLPIVWLALGLLLEVLQDIHDAAALGLVGGGCGCAQLVLLVALLGLHEGHELALVRAGEACCIHHHGEGLHQVGHAGGVDLSQGCCASKVGRVGR